MVYYLREKYSQAVESAVCVSMGRSSNNGKPSSIWGNQMLEMKQQIKAVTNTIKSKFHFEIWKKKTETEYTDLAPIDKIENGSEYLNALDWALNNKRIKNIALAGPYGSGKSSIIETYLKQHPSEKKKSLRISMATFAENTVSNNGKPQKIDIEQEEIELGILKQLFYKVDYKKTPQSRYRKLHRISWKSIWGCLIGLSIIIFLIGYIFFPKLVDSAINQIVTAGSSINVSNKVSLSLFGILILTILAIFSVIYRSILSHFKVKEIKFPVDATIKSGEDTNETVFNKYMDEIAYFFEETKYRLVFFEDLDRLEDSSIFVHLRELNILLNNYNVIKEPIVFIYAVKDNIFSETDRTKFFEFIIPVIPIINSTNSGEILLKKLDKSNEVEIKHEISRSFVLDVCPYISDMRILQNIYNEFIVYKKTLRIEQGLKLLDEPMMALIIFKNLYPFDFANIQMEQGVIKQAFADKQDYLELKQEAIQREIDESIKVLEGIRFEALNNIKELKISLLCEITNWRGMAVHIILNDGSNIYARDVVHNDFLTQLSSSKKCSGYFYDWNENGRYHFSCETFSEIWSSYCEREKRIRLIEENSIIEEQKKVEKLKVKLHEISGWSLQHLIAQFGVEEVLSTEVRKNKLLAFLLRRGYIDEKYVNYINYFKGNTVTKADMNFILSVKNMEPQPFNYALTKISMVTQRLQSYEFRQKAIYNFDLLEAMLFLYEVNTNGVYRDLLKGYSDDLNKDYANEEYIEEHILSLAGKKCFFDLFDSYKLNMWKHIESDFAGINKKLDNLIKQLSDEDEQSWEFIDEFVEETEYVDIFIKLLASNWSNMWAYISKNAVLSYERKVYYLKLIISNIEEIRITAMNKNNEISDFIEKNEDILQKLNKVDSNLINKVITALQVKFKKVKLDNVPDEVREYIFTYNYYELNPHMIHQIVQHKNIDLVTDLESKSYTTIIKLGYTPLIEYVRANLLQYIETIVLAGKRAFDEEQQILDLLERSINNQALCIKLIEHEEFCMEDITCCCKNYITENKSSVKCLWDTLLKNNKILPTWENINRYWLEFMFTRDLITFIETHIDNLVGAESKCNTDDFIREFITAEINDKAYEILLPRIRMNNFDVPLDAIPKRKLSIMINCKYFEFTINRYEKIKSLFPDLCAEFILQNQAECINNIDNIQMDSSLLESLFFSNKIELNTAQKLLDYFGNQYMTNGIAKKLIQMGLIIDLQIFNTAWEHLNVIEKQEFLFEHLELLDSDALHFCFIGLEKRYSDFLDRSKRHVVELADTPENQRLVERLKDVKYITSYQLNEKKEYDHVSKCEIIRKVILCRVKAIT